MKFKSLFTWPFSLHVFMLVWTSIWMFYSKGWPFKAFQFTLFVFNLVTLIDLIRFNHRKIE